MIARSERCRGGLPAPPVRISSRCSSTWSKSSTASQRTRAAASSMPSGKPSRRWQMFAIVSSSSGAAHHDRSDARARSRNNATAGESEPAAARGATSQTCSASTPSRSLDVVSTSTAAVDCTRWRARWAAPSSTCSQLSRMMSARRCASRSAICASSPRSPSSCTPRMFATVRATEASELSTVKSQMNTPSGYPGATWAATSVARRVLPTPPGPHNVTRRWR